MPGTDRVPYLTERSDLPVSEREHVDRITESRGRIIGPFAVLLNSPDLAGRVGHLGAYVRFEGGLAAVDRELAILATAREMECAFEWATHAPIAREAGLDESTLEIVAQRGDLDRLDPWLATVVGLTRDLLAEKQLSAETFAAAHDALGDAGVVELVATVGYYTMIACVLNGFAVRPDEETPVG